MVLSTWNFEYALQSKNTQPKTVYSYFRYLRLLKVYTCLYRPRREKTCLWGFGNNTGADQPAHTCRLISAFVIRFMECITCISKLATSEISMV